MSSQNNKKEGLKIVREFKAPKKLVFEAFSSEAAFAEWWGPVGTKITVKHFDFKPGGTLHYKMDGNGQTMWGIFQFGKIAEPDLIEFISSFSDEAGNICKSPFPIDFPFEIYNQITLEENLGITTLTLQGYPVNATPEQEGVYYSIMENMNQGFNGTFDQLEEHLSKVQQ